MWINRCRKCWYLAKIPEMAELAMICDTDDKTLKRFSKSYKQVELIKDYKLILERKDIDAVHICLPHHLHAKFAVEALNAGKHVLCEKPMANTLEECDRMIDAAKKSGKKFMIAENQRFLPAHIKIKEIIDSGAIGEIKMVRTYEGGSEVGSMSDENSWKCNWSEGGGGAWMDSGVHRLAVLNYLVGDVASISGQAERLLSKCENKADDNCAFEVQFENGALGQIAISFTVASEWDCDLMIYGTKGTILERHNREKPIQLYSTLPGENSCKWIEPEVVHKPYPGYYSISFAEEIKHFYDCIINNNPVQFTGLDGRKALEVVLKGYEASKTKQRVSIKK
jgi:UDP-N-acetylglucosamine 3-dehydrogenase